MLEVTESASTFAVVMLIFQIVYFGYNQTLSSCYEIHKDDSFNRFRMKPLLKALILLPSRLYLVRDFPALSLSLLCSCYIKFLGFPNIYPIGF